MQYLAQSGCSVDFKSGNIVCKGENYVFGLSEVIKEGQQHGCYPSVGE